MTAAANYYGITATIAYRTGQGLCPVEHDLEELSEIEALIERGPHWDAIESISIVKQRSARAITVEEAEAE